MPQKKQNRNTSSSSRSNSTTHSTNFKSLSNHSKQTFKTHTPQNLTKSKNIILKHPKKKFWSSRTKNTTPLLRNANKSKTLQKTQTQNTQNSRALDQTLEHYLQTSKKNKTFCFCASALTCSEASTIFEFANVSNSCCNDSICSLKCFGVT